MSQQNLKVKGYTPDQIKRLIDSEEQYIIGIRLYAVYQISLGKSSRTMEELYNFSFKQIINWVHQFEQDGIDGLRNKSGRGRKSLLSNEQLETIRLALLKDSPNNNGSKLNKWTGPKIQTFIKDKFGITYNKAQVYNIMKSLGFTYQKGKGIYPNSDQKEI